ncbi:MAG: hypothetical protein M5U19_07225 [Microthrixaceae bacterium]|nr:hypothetical protein [Microthrixaceae bacterium]
MKPWAAITGLSVAAATGGWVARLLRSPAVRAWEQSELPIRQIGRLSCKLGGTGPGTALLLHGLVATGDVFGRSPDILAVDHEVAVPDLAGFGRSLDEGSSAPRSPLITSRRCQEPWNTWTAPLPC